MQITVTPDAVVYIRNHLKIAGPIRLLIEKSGCSGVSFKFSLASVISDEDITVFSNGIEVVVARAQSDDLDGTVVSVKRHSLGTSLEVSNPNYVPSCGCGKSFTKNP